MYGDDNNKYLIPNNVTLNSSNSSMILSQTNIASLGSTSFNIYSVLSGQVNVTGIINSTIYTDEILLTILQDQLRVSFSQSANSATLLTSKDTVNLIVSVYDNSNTILLTQANDLTVSLNINCAYDKICSGSVASPLLSTGSISSGIYNLTGFSIKSSGMFTINATHSDMLQGSLTTGNITNYVKTISPSSAANVSANFSTIINISLIGDDNNAYILPANVNISGSNLASNNSSNTTSTGSTALTVWFTAPGNFTPKISIISQTVTTNTSVITVLKDKLVINGISPIPQSNLDVFNLTVLVCSNNGSAVESLHGPYNISLNLIPSGIITPSSVMTINGSATFSGKISTDNTYIISVTSDNMDPVNTTRNFTIVSSFSNLTLSNSLPQPVNTILPLTFFLYESNGSPFLRNTVVNLTCPNIINVTSLTQYAVNGAVTFNGYFNTTGTKVCTAKANSTAQTFTYNLNISGTINTISASEYIDFENALEEGIISNKR